MNTSHLLNLKNRIKGPVFSILTPFNKDSDEIDFKCLGNYIQRIYDSGGRQFYVMAYNSRYSQLSWDEIKELNRFVASTVKSISAENIVIVADPIHCSTKVAIDFAQHAEQIGADLISIIVRERFFSEEQILRHFEMISEQVGIGILVHEMPFLCGYGGPPVNYPITLLDRIADVKQVIAIKEDAKDDQYSSKVIDKVKDRLAIVISGGGKRQWLRFAELGCQSWLNGIGVFEPRLAVEFWNAWQVGNANTVQMIIDQVEIPFFELGVDKFGWHLTIKAALEAQGIMSRHDRMPLMPLRKEQYKEVRELVERLSVDELLAKIES